MTGKEINKKEIEKYVSGGKTLPLWRWLYDNLISDTIGNRQKNKL